MGSARSAAAPESNGYALMGERMARILEERFPVA
jgi:hypothetical protein